MGQDMVYKSGNMVDVDGTQAVGHISADYSALVKVFGEPTPPPDSKSDAEWIGELDGMVFTIYNWKNGQNWCGPQGTATKDIKVWNIGGHSVDVVNRISSYMRSKLS